MPPESTPRATQANLQRVSQGFMLAFLAISLTLVFWSFVRADAILSREDNPRQFLAEQQIRRGTILDRNGVVLAESVPDPDNLTLMLRRYPAPAGGPAVGYYSLRYGVSGIEESYDATLRGAPVNDWQRWEQTLLHRPQSGQDVQVTLDATLQTAAAQLLGNRAGALLLLSLPETEILALVSSPGYDPNQLDAQFDALLADDSAPLLNRVTQGQYQPGRILQPFVLATAVADEQINITDTAIRPNRPVPIGDKVLQCDSAPPAPADWADVIALHCPAPFVDLGMRLGSDRLTRLLTDFGLRTQPNLPLALPDAPEVTIDDPALAALGQEMLTVTPLQVGLALAALGNAGQLTAPQLVMAVQAPDGSWQPVSVSDEPQTAVSHAAADHVLQALPVTDNIRENRVLVVAGPGGATNAWYLGLYPAGLPQYALVIVLEEQADLTAVTTIGRTFLQTLPTP